MHNDEMGQMAITVVSGGMYDSRIVDCTRQQARESIDDLLADQALDALSFQWNAVPPDCDA